MAKRRLPTISIDSIKKTYGVYWYKIARKIFGNRRKRINALDVIFINHPELNQQDKLCFFLNWDERSDRIRGNGRFGIRRRTVILPRVLWKKYHDRAQEQNRHVWPTEPSPKRNLADIRRDLLKWLEG